MPPYKCDYGEFMNIDGVARAGAVAFGTYLPAKDVGLGMFFEQMYTILDLWEL